MISAQVEISNEDEFTFDTYGIDTQIFKKGEYTQYDKKNADQVINKFKHLEGLTEAELEKKDENIDFPKYFSKISTKTFEYIGILSKELKRVQYGYSLMENGDKYLGEYKDEIRDGFGIYKFHQNDEDQDIYIGEYKNDKKSGKGIYLKVSKSVIDEESKESKLINFNCGIGELEEDLFKNIKIFCVNNDKETLYKGKINELGIPSDEAALIVENWDKIFFGKYLDGDMLEGRNIFIDEKGEKQKAYYFTKNEKKEFGYNFDLNKNEEKDKEIVKKVNESSKKNYKNQIQNIFKEINNAFNAFQNFDSAIKVNFEKDIKNKIQSIINKIIEE